MDKRQAIIKQWMESTDAAIEALEDYRHDLEDWHRRLNAGGFVDHDEFMRAFRHVSEAGLEDWIDGNPLNVDKLAAVVEGDELPEPVDPVTAIFGEA